ncbi:hypothetical protein [Nesterenkonia alkaliphila]|uniref:Uncharacterized protein n=1 Tax=Nesterenkonia alkaliphila TaxID=1463631 RepID=A0A7K1UIV5_9MICC|nr:hypothetical protein [Nesterenkonia alkaliphila]MVT26408.1 hypothetical protein [Nesterenkonia alkaliphila]GFZ82625.1 hypothetical protein GCM10011359_09070 [Nesterenkonia alkaliphila]
MTREFGSTAWGRAWLKQIEPVLITGPPDRDLPRARALARRAIDDLTIEANQITARLTDRGHEHTITLNIPTWNHREQTVVARTIGQATPSRSGDLPDHLVTELTSAGVRVAPRIDDISATSHTDEASRRHVLAICYALVQNIDEEPVVAVRLRMPRVTAPHSGGSASDDMLALADIDPRTFYATIIL